MNTCNHICGRHANKKSHIMEVVEVDEILNLKQEMQEMCEEMAFHHHDKSGLKIAQEVMKYFIDKYGDQPIALMEINQLRSMVYRTRTKEFGSWEGLINTFPLHSCLNSEKKFLLFNNYFTIKDECYKFLGWGHPELRFECKHGDNNLFIDCTFKVVPFGFSQCMVIMVYLSAYRIYVPIMYILLQGKYEEIYRYALQEAISSTDWELNAKSTTCDFEIGLMNAVKFQFGEGKHIGCLFHFLQAILRKLNKIKMPDQIIAILMTDGPGSIKILTVVPLDELDKAIAYIKYKLLPYGNTILINEFFYYIKHTWMTTYNPADWNVSAYAQVEDTSEILINRTNNPCERFNKKMNSRFPEAKPNMIHFVTVIREISEEYVQDLKTIRRCKPKFLKNQRIINPSMYTIPVDYNSFV